MGDEKANKCWLMRSGSCDVHIDDSPLFQRHHCTHCGRSFCRSTMDSKHPISGICGECKLVPKDGKVLDDQPVVELPLESNLRSAIADRGRRAIERTTSSRTGRRMIGLNGKPYRDSPVLLRLLDEIREAQQRQANH